MKKNKYIISLKGRIFVQFLLFAVYFLVILWLLQIVYLKDIYRKTKIWQADRMLNDTEAFLKTPQTGTRDYSVCNLIAERNDMRLMITDSECRVLYTSNPMFILRQKVRALAAYYQKAAENGGELMLFLEGDARNEYIQDLMKTEVETVYNRKMFRDENVKNSLICARIADIEGNKCLIVVTLLLTPDQATVSTIRLILIIVSVFSVAVTMLLAGRLSRQLSEPIEEISRGTEKMAGEDYSTVFPESRIREIAELSKTLNTTEKELQKTALLRRELVANVSHDLRTPLTMIKGYAEVMRDIPGENTAENLQTVIDETERLSSLVSDLLDVSRIQADVIKLNMRRYCLTESVRSVLKRYSSLVRNDGFTIEFEAAENAYIEADEDKIYQVLYNLINNAINYSDESRTVRVLQTVQDGMVKISVEDYGRGIQEEELPYVWERYYRSTEQHKLERIGTGLGLSIVKSVLELHQAQYGVSSRVGEGSIFWFSFPCA